jgi:aspartyl-tRNA(Asn)/glutamyl-tRNA(Gln) amidotransferase subunit C
MSISREEVERIAHLAELQVDEAALAGLVDQLSRILDYVAQIATVAAAESAPPFLPGPAAARFRSDEVRPAPLAFGPERMAPAFRDGFFLVPRLGAFGPGHTEAAEDDA